VVFRARLPQLPPTLWATADRAFAQIFSLLIFVVQARILGPRAFGIIAIVTVFLSFWEAVPGIANTDALISIRDIEPLHFSTTTTVCALLSLVAGAAVFVLAKPVAAAFGEAQLTSVMHVMAVLPLVQAFSIAPTAAAEREMRFRSTALRTSASLFLGGVVGLVMAVAGAGVWALVCQALVQRCVAAVVLWLAVPISFGFGISSRHFRELARFAWPVMLARAMSWASAQIPRLILGFYLGSSELGLFSLATRLHDVVSQVAIVPRALVARVDLRRFASNRAALGQAVRQVSLHISFLSFPLCIGGAVVTPTLFHAWLDQRWHGAIIPSQIMLLMIVPFATVYIAAAALLALNCQRSEAGLAMAQGISIIISTAVAAPFGLVAATAAIAIIPAAIIPFSILVMRRQCGVSLRDILLPQGPALVGASLMGISVLGLRIPIEAIFMARTALAIEIAFGVVLYAILIALMVPGPAIKVFTMIGGFFGNKNRDYA
jgi:O-antigen/teichoic acid export membrane protein